MAWGLLGATMSPTDRKRPFGANIKTLSDITNSPSKNVNQSINQPTAAAASDNLPKNNAVSAPSPNDKIKIQHIPTLPRADEASAILERIHSEFSQIIQKRSFNVLSITEMCCCSDGLDHLPSSRRKTKLMPNNVLGYNLTQFGRKKSHAIHLRLRHPKTHEIVDYESIAGTMCHELAHCVVGPHNAEFYKVMEEIEEQYAMFLARGVVLDKQGFPVGSDDAHRLGGRKVSPEEARRKSRLAAEKRAGLSCGSYVLGGSRKKCDPKEAARIAAERRLRDSQFCLPCDEVIELLGDDSDDEDNASIIEKKKAKSIKTNSESSQVIDLTEDEPNQIFQGRKKSTVSIGSNQIHWECACCTLINQPASLTCEMCEAPPNIPAAASAPSGGTTGATSAPSVDLNGNRGHDKVKSCTEEADDRVWTCRRCTFDNQPLSLVCGACCLER